MNFVAKLLSVALASLCLLTSAAVTPKARAFGQEQAASATQTNSSDEEAIRKVVTDSQFNETLVIYVSPATFDKSLLTKYWVPEEKGGEAIVQVENSVRRLLDKHWHYAKESANEQFEIRSVQIFPPGDVAEVRTRERWYVPTVDDEGRLVRERDSIIEYPVRYRLLKIDGTWLIQKSSASYRDRD